MTGYADYPDGWNMDWNTLATMQATNWYIELHAGPLGHATINPANAALCLEFYACRFSGETAAAYQTRVKTDLAAGLFALQAHGMAAGQSSTFALVSFDNMMSKSQ